MLIALLLLFIPALHAGVLVVSQENPQASDDNAGTEAQPLKSISAAAARAQAGDRVLIHRGTYRETVIVTTSGTEKEPIVFEAAAGERPVIKGSEIITGWARDEGDVWKASLPALPERGASAKESSFWRTNDVRQVFTRDGELLDAQRLRRVTTRAAMEAGTFFCDVKAATLFIWLADSASPLEHPPEVSLRGAWLYVYGSHVVVRGLAMRHASTTAIAAWPACNLTGDHITLEDCVISWGDFAGVSLAGKANRLLRVTTACHGAAGAGGTGEDHLIEGCRFIFNNVDRYDIQWHAGGAKLIPNLLRSVIRGNEFAHNLGPGLWLDAGCNENIIDGNYAHENEGPGIMVEISTGNLVMNNVTVGNQNPRSGMFRDGEANEKTVIYSERMVAPSRLLRPYHAGDGRGIYISSAPQTKVLHNTSFRNEAEGICVEGPPRSDGIRTVSTGGSVVKNNITVFNHGSQLTVRPSEPDAPDSRTTSDYNLLFSVGAVLAKNGWEGSAVFDLPQWQKVSGQDGHSLDVDPQFAMAAMNDFRLLAESPGLSAATPLAEVAHDYWGRPRDREKSTVGAFEGRAGTYPVPLSAERVSLPKADLLERRAP